MPSAVIHLHTGVVDRCPTAGGIASTSMTTALVNSVGVDAFVLHQLPDSRELAFIAGLEQLELKLFGDFGHGWRSTYWLGLLVVKLSCMYWLINRYQEVNAGSGSTSGVLLCTQVSTEPVPELHFESR